MSHSATRRDSYLNPADRLGLPIVNVDGTVRPASNRAPGRLPTVVNPTRPAQINAMRAGSNRPRKLGL